ncbi:MAG: HD domain-containing protein, partial [Mariprofundus sp.]
MERLNISTLSQSPMRFEGIYRISSCRTLIAQTGKRYQRLSMEDSTGCMTAYSWSPEQSNFDDNSHFHISGRSRYYNGAYVADIATISATFPCPEELMATLPFSQCPRPESLAEVARMILDIEHKGLRGLLCHTFSQEHIALPFMQVPASLNYHHNHPGGLLEHSLECAHIIRDLSIFSQHERELGITAALLHDLGKIKTIGADFSRPELSKAIDHEAI